MEQRFTFDEVAAEYAAARPAYPAQLFEDLIRIAALHAGSRVLEIGCGPGNATVGLVGRGFSLICLEPGPRLAALARARLAGTAVVVIEQTFEDYALPAEPFDLVFAAQPDARARLLAAIGQAIDEAGGSVTIDDEVGFCCGRPRTRP